jgi:serine protease AprX
MALATHEHRPYRSESAYPRHHGHRRFCNLRRRRHGEAPRAPPPSPANRRPFSRFENPVTDLSLYGRAFACWVGHTFTMTRHTSLRRTLVRALAIATLALATATPALAQHLPSDKLDPVLRARAQQPGGRSRVIVEFHEAPDIRAIQTRRGVPGRVLARHRAQVAEVDDAMLGALATDPRVARIVVDRPVFAMAERTGIATGAALVRYETGLTGRNVGVVVVDSGMTRTHPDLGRPVSGRPGGTVVHFKDFTRRDTPGRWMNEVPSDDYGHATHVAGLIAGNGSLSDGARMGIAPGAHLIGLKVLDGWGHGHVSDVIAAIDYAIDLRDAYNVRIVNLSVGAGVYESYEHDPLALAARRAVEAGLVVVAAAGNLGRGEDGDTQYASITSPANAPWVLTVGASTHQGTVRRSDDAVAPFSSRGPTWIDFSAKPDIVAPGVGLESLADPHSLLYDTLGDYLLDGSRRGGHRPYLSMSGTSMAAPVVTGAVALMLEANPSLTPNAVKALLQYTAQPLPDGEVLAQGAGLVNIAGAVRLARFFADPTRHFGEPADIVAGEPIAWAQHLIWGNDRVTGGVPLPGSNAWEPGLTWGADSMPDRAPVFWGATHAHNIVWSTGLRQNIVWSTGLRQNIVWSTTDEDNAIWGTRLRTNIVWSTTGGDQAVWDAGLRTNIVWSTTTGTEVWDSRLRTNIVWSTGHVENVVWGDACGGGNCTLGEDAVEALRLQQNIVWSTGLRQNIVWSTGLRQNIVWSTNTPEPVLWPAEPHTPD